MVGQQQKTLKIDTQTQEVVWQSSESDLNTIKGFNDNAIAINDEGVVVTGG